MKFFTHNRGAAVAALVVAIALSLVFGTYRSTGALEKKAEAVFSESGGAADMAVFLDAASQIGAIWSAVMGSDDTSATFDALYAEANVSYPIASASAASSLRYHVAVMYNMLANGNDMTDAQAITAKRYYYDMLNAWTMLCENDEYKKSAEKYNNAIAHFPANLCQKKSAALFS